VNCGVLPNDFEVTDLGAWPQMRGPLEAACGTVGWLLASRRGRFLAIAAA